MSDDFLASFETEKKEASPIVLEDVAKVVRTLVETKEKIRELEESIEALRGTERELSEKIIPELLLQSETTELKLIGGVSVSIEQQVYASVPKDPEKQARCLAWLRANGGGDLEKDLLTIEAPEREVLEALEQKGVLYERKKDVNSRSLVAWLKDTLGLKKGSVARCKVEDVPPEMNLFRPWTTKVKGL